MHHRFYLASILVLFAIQEIAFGTFVETYWECWNQENRSDYGSQLENLSVGRGYGKINFVDVAFSDFLFFMNSAGQIEIGYVNEVPNQYGDVFSVQDLQSAIAKIHAAGGKVKLSFGGPQFYMSGALQSVEDAVRFAQNVTLVVAQNNFDGVDFQIVDQSTKAEIQIAVFKELRQMLGQDAILSYTIPVLSESVEPWSTVIAQSSVYMSYITVMAWDYNNWQGYTFDVDLQNLELLGIPPSKIVLGMVPGSTDSNEYVSPDQAAALTRYAVDRKLAGVMYWDVNRDTNHRTSYSPGSNVYETGLPDGTYLSAITNVTSPVIFW